jgi:hypothetical protein
VPSFEVTVTHLSGPRLNDVETFASVPVRIGRSEDCQVRFDPDKDTKVSAEHAELRTGNDGGLELRDLDSRNGVWLNGAKVIERAPLPNHAIIEIGVNGPRLRITYEAGAGGVSFGQLRKEKTGKIKRKGLNRRLAETDEVQVYSEADLESDEGPLPLGLEPQQALLIGVGVLLLLLGGCYFLG